MVKAKTLEDETFEVSSRHLPLGSLAIHVRGRKLKFDAYPSEFSDSGLR
jgi:hypothetical protein